MRKNKFTKHSALYVAQILLLKLCLRKKYINAMKLNKLLYFAYGWYLSIHNEKLFEESICNYKYGPVVKSVFDEYKKYGNNLICLKDIFFVDECILKEDVCIDMLIEGIINLYGNYSPTELAIVAHLKGTPWDTTDRNELFICDDVIREYFLRKMY